MNRHPERVNEFLQHMLEAIGNIREYLGAMDYGAFLTNRLVQDAVLRNLEIIGEAAEKIRKNDGSFEGRHPDFPLRDAYDLRNWIVHGYFKIDLQVIWNTIESDLPLLEERIRAIIGPS